MKTQSKAPAVRNPQGRADWLASRLLEKAVAELPEPLMQMAYRELQPHIERAIKQHLGPRTRRGRQVRDFTRQVETIMKQAQRRTQA